jgi:hypothetical protein
MNHEGHKGTRRKNAKTAELYPRAVLLSIRDYVKLADPEPEVLRIIGGEAEQNGTSKLTSRQINQIIQAARSKESPL